jgi:putative Mg2+ transporter-C (MgtC) family protein
MPTFAFLTYDWSLAWISLGKILLAYLLTLPAGWESEREAHSVGVRTFPIVAMASCGYLLLVTSSDPASQSRVLQGLITGIGFVGGGAILKEGATVRGTATAASIWSTGVVGAAVAMGRYEIAVILSALNFLTLKMLWNYKQKLDRQEGVDMPHHNKKS